MLFPGEVILEVENLSLPKKFENVSFNVRGGEILGFSGLMGAGRTDVMHAIFGSVKPTSGKIKIRGNEVNITSPIVAKKLGIGFITEDRKNEGIILDFSVAENLILPSLKEFTKSGLVQNKLKLEETEA